MVPVVGDEGDFSRGSGTKPHARVHPAESNAQATENALERLVRNAEQAANLKGVCIGLRITIARFCASVF